MAEYEICPSCDGRGQVEVEIRNSRAKEWKPCLSCNERGERQIQRAESPAEFAKRHGLKLKASRRES